MSENESAVVYYRKSCNKLVNGSCYATRCLRRGGYAGGGEKDPHWNDAICEALEAVSAFTELETTKNALLLAQGEMMAAIDKAVASDAEI